LAFFFLRLLDFFRRVSSSSDLVFLLSPISSWYYFLVVCFSPVFFGTGPRVLCLSERFLYFSPEFLMQTMVDTSDWLPCVPSLPTFRLLCFLCDPSLPTFFCCNLFPFYSARKAAGGVGLVILTRVFPDSQYGRVNCHIG